MDAKIVGRAGTREVVSDVDNDETEERADESDVDGSLGFLTGRGCGLFLEGPGGLAGHILAGAFPSVSKGIGPFLRCLEEVFWDVTGISSLSPPSSTFSAVLRVRRPTGRAGGEVMVSTLTWNFSRAGPLRSILPFLNKRRPRGAAESCGGGASMMTGLLSLFIPETRY